MAGLCAGHFYEQLLISTRESLKMTPAPSQQSPVARPSRAQAARLGRRLGLVLNGCFFAYVAYWLYANVDYEALLTEFQRLPPRAILVAMAMNAVVLTLYGLRLAAIMGAKAFPCFVVETIGFTFNALIPFRIGEGVKAYVGATQFGFPIGALGAAIVLEKLYDLAAIAVLATLAGATSHVTVIDNSYRPLLAIPFLVAAVAFLVLRSGRNGAIAPLSHNAVAKRLRLDGLAAQAETLFATQDVRRPALITASIWAANSCLVLVLFKTILPQIAFGLPDAMTLLVIGALAIAIPASPAGLGVFEAGIAAYLINFHGVEKESAVAAALAYHLAITTPHTVFALIFVGVFCIRALKARPVA
jgi:uncharacterized protein (TIRG00374 family)